VSHPPRCPYLHHALALTLRISVYRLKVPMLNEDEKSAHDQEGQNVLLEEIRNRVGPLHTSFWKYTPYFDKRRPCGPISLDAR